MDGRQALTQIGAGGLLAEAFWPSLARALPRTEITHLEFHSMGDLALFLERGCGIEQKIPGLVFVPTIYTAKGLTVLVNIMDEVSAGFCRVNGKVAVGLD